jgi:Immunoglobulin I-set domain
MPVGAAAVCLVAALLDGVPAVTAQPRDQTVVAGEHVSFAAAASGSPAPTVQWELSTDGGLLWSPVAGAAAPTLTFVATPARNRSRYRAVFTNGSGTATSRAALLTVESAPVVTVQPAAVTAPAGGAVSFSAAATGVPEPTVRWQVSTDDGRSWSTVAGATGTTLTLPTAAAQNGNRYRAVFANAVGRAASAAARLTVLGAPVVTRQPVAQTARPGTHVTFTVAVNSALPVTLRWQVSRDGGGTWTAIDGATGTTLTVVASAGSLYRALVTNPFGTTASAPAALRLAAPVLPATGAAPGLRVAIGLALLAAGCVLLAAGRRRRD